jgi:hypothetical protein
MKARNAGQPQIACIYLVCIIINIFYCRQYVNIRLSVLDNTEISKYM